MEDDDEEKKKVLLVVTVGPSIASMLGGPRMTTSTVVVVMMGMVRERLRLSLPLFGPSSGELSAKLGDETTIALTLCPVRSQPLMRAMLRLIEYSNQGLASPAGLLFSSTLCSLSAH